MNGMANLPQIYQDMMRTHLVNALNQQQQQQNLTQPQRPSNNTSLGTSLLTASRNIQQQSSMNQFNQSHQQQMAAAVAAVIQKQQQTNYVTQMQAQMNVVAAAAASAASNTPSQPQFRPNSGPVQTGFQYPQKSFFMPSNIDQIQSTINSFYQQQNVSNSQKSYSKENLLLHQQDLMQQHIEAASKRHNTLARQEAASNEQKLINGHETGQYRGRGRPKRQQTDQTQFKRTPSPSPSNASKLNSPVSDATKSRSISPKETKHLKKSHSMELSLDNIKTETVTRTSTPSHISELHDNSDANSIISNSIKDEAYDDANNDNYSSIYDGVEANQVELDIDDVEHSEIIHEEDIEGEELNTTSSTSSNNHQKQALNATNQNPSAAVYDFNLQALEMSLYGYLQHTDPMFASHAISGLRVPPFRQFKANKEPSLFSSSSSSSINTDIKNPLSNSKKSNFSIENLLTSSGSSSSSSSVSSSSNYSHQQQQQQHPLVDLEKLDLPDELQIRSSLQGDIVHYGVFCKKTVVPKSTRFGPFPGKVVYPNEIKPNEDNNHMWEIFNDGRLSHFIDGRPGSSQQKSTMSPSQLNITSSSFASSTSGQSTGANQWMIYVNCARFAQEQNLIAVQLDGEIFYEVCKDIAQGQELLVWYGDSYLQFLGIPVSLKDMTDEISEDTSENKDGYACDRCGKVFAYKYYRDKHLKYTRCVDQGDRKFPCHLCTRSFEKRDRLRIHILHVHEKHRPHKCSVCGKSFSQSSSLNKHMRVHSGERPYKCVYCNKAFTASSILRTHIRQHSGEKPFKCKYCGKAFASHAAHDSHVRRTHNIVKDKEANLIL